MSAERTRTPRRVWVVGGVVVVVAAVAVFLALSDDDAPAVATATSTSSTGTPAVTTSSPAVPTASPSASASPTAASTQGPVASVRPSSSASARPTPRPTVAVPVPPIDDRTPTQSEDGGPVSDHGLQVDVTQVRSVQSAGTGPGEISGPAYAVTVVVDNGSASPFDASGMTVSLFAGAEGVPLSTVDSDPKDAPLSGTVAAGASGTGTYIFAAGSADELPLAAFVDLSAKRSPVIFQGLTPR